MNQEKVMKIAFIVNAIAMLIAAALKILHIGGMGLFFSITLTAAVLWTALALVEVYSSKRLHITEKSCGLSGSLFSICWLAFCISFREDGMLLRGSLSLKNKQKASLHKLKD